MKARVRSLFVVIDIIFIAIAFYLPYLARYNYGRFPRLITLPVDRFLPNLWLPSLGSYTLVYLFWGMLVLLLLHHYDLFSTLRELSYLDESLSVLKAILFSVLPAAGAVFFLQVKFYSRLVFVLNTFSLFLLLSGWRMVKRYSIRRRVARGHDNIRVLVVGAGKMGKLLVREIRARPYLGWEIVGYLDDRQKEEAGCGPILGTWEDFETVVRQKFVDEVLVTVPSERRKVAELIQKSQILGVGIRLVPDLLELTTQEVEASAVGNIPLLEYHSHRPHGADLAIKRLFDLAVSGLALLGLLPFYPLIALLIKIDSPGPVFYRSRRCGKNRRVFSFYKFRSMVAAADRLLEGLRDRNEMDGPVFKMKDDPRITRVGKWLRRFSIDEFPQLWNVFKGDMSLVGPRPPTPEEVEFYSDRQLKRLEIRPGITCIWQTKGRSDLSFEEWMKWDLFYIENWSFWLDVKILLQTVISVVRGKGAY